MSKSALDDERLDERLRVMFDTVMPLLDDVEQVSDAGPQPTRRWRIGAAAACVVMVGGGFVAVGSARRDAGSHTDDTVVLQSPTPASATTVAEPDPDTLTLTMSDDDSLPSPWDPIRIAPGTTGWYDLDLDALDPDVRDQVGERSAWSPDFISRFYRCVSWTEDAEGPICDRLATGGRELVSYGGSDDFELSDHGVGIGTNLVARDAEDLLWSLARGSLWGYDTVTEPPPPDEVSIGSRTAYQYRNGDAAYLLWEQEPGVFVWLKSHGLDNETLSALAASVVPVAVPERMPVLLSVEDESLTPEPVDDFVETTARLLLGWVDGQPCVTFGAGDSCTPLHDEPVLLVGGLQEAFTASVAVVAPRASDVHLEVDLFELGEQKIDVPVEAVGWSSMVFHAGTERLLAARLVDGTGSVIESREFDVNAFAGGGYAGLVAEGRVAGGAWVVLRQDPAEIDEDTGYYLDPSLYCWILTAPQQGAPLCLRGPAPNSGLGTHADHHIDFDLVEVADDVRSAACGDVDLPIHTDDRNGRRFIVSPCDYGEVTVVTD